MIKTFITYFLFASSLLLVPRAAVFADVERGADTIFSEMEHSIFQVRMMENKSGSRAALGTGFLLEGGYIATNYHVVSEKVLKPDDFRIEVDQGDVTFVMEVVTVDVVSDLAVLRTTDGNFTGRPFVLSGQRPRRGEILYSLGNPHDLGLTVVQGNYNGLVENKFLDRIHFSGAINSGMSGGPTVNRDSEVVGINVATAGNQIGFLVPVAALGRLVGNIPELTADYDLLTDMARQIGVTTDAMIDDILATQWPLEKMGGALILGKTVNWFECWGNSEEEEDRNLLEIARGCNNADNIFINAEVNTGYMEYEFYYLEGTGWPQSAFYRLMAENTSIARPGNESHKDHMSDYRCVNEIIHTPASGEGKGMRRRAGYCVRAYKQLPGLHDVFFIGVSLDQRNKGAMDHFTLSGVTRRAADRFLRRFAEVIQWQ